MKKCTRCKKIKNQKQYFKKGDHICRECKIANSPQNTLTSYTCPVCGRIIIAINDRFRTHLTPEKSRCSASDMLIGQVGIVEL